MMILYNNSSQKVLCHLLFSTIQLQEPKKYKKLLLRRGHGAATLTVNSDCVEVILFGGYGEGDSLMVNTTILRLGECMFK